VTFQEKNIAAYLAFFFLALLLTVFIHQSATFAGSLPGHLVGIVGAVLMFMALAYPVRKRVLGKRGKENPLTRHILYGLAGSCLALIHSAHQFGSVIGLVLLITVLVVVFSGIVGFFLFRRISRTIKEQRGDLEVLKRRFEAQKEDAKACLLRLDMPSHAEMKSPLISNGEEETDPEERCREAMNVAYSIAELEYTLRVFSRLKALFSVWTRVHYFLAFFLFSILIVHVLNVLYYGIRWL